MARYLDTISHPWSRGDIEVAIFKDSSEARESIENTSGGKLWNSINDIEDSIWIFEASTSSLLDEICLFGDRSKNSSFWQVGDSHEEAEKHARIVKMKIFHCTSSLMALVDHSRNFQNANPISGYSNRIGEVFLSHGPHDFLKCLRNYNTHWRIAQANWVIRHDFKTGFREARFTVSKKDLLRWDRWSRKAREFIEGSAEKIDVYDIFFAYRKQVQNFYSWHRGVLLDEYSEIIRPYLEYKRVYKGLQKKYHWNFVLSSARETLNPFQYIGQHLPRCQVEKLLTYEHRSEAQVDALIEMLGMEEFCDESLRGKAISLFKSVEKT